jgi:hypothetical protein
MILVRKENNWKLMKNSWNLLQPPFKRFIFDLFCKFDIEQSNILYIKQGTKMSIGVKKNHFILLLIYDLRRDYDNMDYFFQLFSEFVFSWKMQDMVRTSAILWICFLLKSSTTPFQKVHFWLVLTMSCIFQEKTNSENSWKK